MAEKNQGFLVRKNKHKALDLNELHEMSNKELIEKVIQLEAYNIQLKNLLQKKCLEENNDFNEQKKKRKFNFDRITKRHVMLKIYYLGWDCQGYVTQDDTCNTIEFYVFKALQQCCLIENRETCNYHRCGRTDKGVSAFCQIISIDLRSKLSQPTKYNCKDELPYCSMLNRLLPNHIRCFAWSHVDDDVSARFDCSSRIYQYYFPEGDLNISLMEQAVKYLIGEHDFRNFCKMDVGNGVTKFIRTIKSAEIRPCTSKFDNAGYQMYKLIIEGNGFLWHQVRCIMGILFLIGQNKEPPDIVQKLLEIEENPKKPQYSMANQVPLTLFSSEYDNVNKCWNVNDKEIIQIIKELQKQWTFYNVKDVMIKEMIDELCKLMEKPINIKSQSEPLLDGLKSKIYKPLLSRMQCESLENRIEHYIKRRRLIKLNENEDT